jgi:arylsulfatase A-like enzyme
MDPNVSGSKSDFYQTPRLEQLANAGMRFSNGYSSTPVCATSRAALQTGMSAAQLQMTDMPQALPPGETTRWDMFYTKLPLIPPAPEPFSANNTTIAHILKQTDPSYVSAHIGKWHLDSITNASPESVGYDFGLELSTSSDPADPWGVFELADLTNSFMEDRVNNNQPFFVQVSHKAVHAPVKSRAEIREKYENLPPGTVHKDPGYAAMTEDLDTSFGMVMDKITELGIEDNTYVIYVSDNGASAGYSRSTPLRLGKATLYEGGNRVPFIVTGPNIEAGSVSSVQVSTTDLLSTIADIAGHQEPLPDQVEGASLVPILQNAGELPAGMDHLSRKFHEAGELYWHFPMNFAVNSASRTRPASTVRDGDFKLMVQYGENGGDDQLFLYNLASNMSETTNLAGSMPGKVTELKAKLDNYLAAVDASFPFEVKTDAVMNWDASQPGAEAESWRSTINLDNKGRETWKLGESSSEPNRQATSAYQPGLPQHTFRFDGDDAMNRLFFQVGDDRPRRASSINTGTPDWDRSVTIESWVRLDSLAQEQILFESGGVQDGISVTLGDADSDGLTNDVRFRVQGFVGPDGGDPNLPLQELTVTAKIDRFANPERDFINVVTVFNDDPNDRYGEIYVNGALAARVNGLLGAEQSLQWDGYDGAGLGNVGGSELGGNSGSGNLPFSGGFQGEMALVRVRNHSISASQVASNYNEFLAPTNYNLVSLGGDAQVPVERPTDTSLGSAESSQLQVVYERGDLLDAPLPVDALISGISTLNDSNDASSGQLAAGTEFSSFLVQFDPLGNAGGSEESVVGSIDFAGDILAILFDAATMEGTDALLGSIGDYGDTGDRGLLLGPEGFLGVSSDQNTLSFELMVPSDEMLQFRVITELILNADFNGDGVVDAADYTVWQDNLGLSASALNGNGSGAATVVQADYLLWKTKFEALATGSESTAAVPEPTTLLLVLLTLAAVPLRVRYGSCVVGIPCALLSADKKLSVKKHKTTDSSFL